MTLSTEKGALHSGLNDCRTRERDALDQIWIANREWPCLVLSS
jgi:hypothetical protein